MSKPNTVTQLLEDLDAGAFAQRLDAALRETAANVIANKRKGKVVIEMELKAIGDSNQVQMTHAIKFSKPTMKGEATEKAITSTPLHVGTGGRLSLFPENQVEMFSQAPGRTAEQA